MVREKVIKIGWFERHYLGVDDISSLDELYI